MSRKRGRVAIPPPIPPAENAAANQEPNNFEEMFAEKADELEILKERFAAKADELEMLKEMFAEERQCLVSENNALKRKVQDLEGTQAGIDPGEDVD